MAGLPGDGIAVLLAARASAGRETLLERLAGLGHRVDVVAHGRDVLGAVRRTPYAVLLLDVALPAGGPPCIERLRAEPGMRDLSIIMLTSSSAEIDDAARCVAQGADECLPLSAAPALLRMRIDTMLKGRRLRQEADTHLEQRDMERRRLERVLDSVIPLSLSLAAEQDFEHLLERILVESMSLCNADAGTLYLRSDNDRLEFAIMRTISLHIARGGTSDSAITFPPIPLYDPERGTPNHHYIAVHAALTGTTLNIQDAYEIAEFDFSGARRFDRSTGYRSTSFLVVPLKNAEQRVIGVVQLINAQDPATGQVIPFDLGQQRMVESLSALAVVALEAYVRVQGLAERVRALEVQIDQTRTARQVAEITDTDYFQRLRSRASDLRTRAGRRSP